MHIGFIEPDDRITLTQVIFFEKLDFIRDTSCTYFFIQSPLRGPENTNILEIKTWPKFRNIFALTSKKVVEFYYLNVIKSGEFSITSYLALNTRMS